MSLALGLPLSSRDSSVWASSAVLPARVLPTAHIRLDVELSTMEALFEEVAQVVVGLDRPKPEHVVRALLRRHVSSSPFIGSGLALARAAVPKIARPLAVYLRLRRPVRLLPTDPQAVSELLTLLVPRPGFLSDHELLVRVTAFLSGQNAAARLRECTDEGAIRHVLTGQD